MKSVRLGLLALAVASMMTLGCGKKDEGDKGGGGESAGKSGANSAVIGKWELSGIFQVLNSKGRVKMIMPGDQAPCLGNYKIEGKNMALDYDDGQESCMDGTMPFEVSADGKTLTFAGMTKYTRVDDKDDTSF